MKVKTKEDVMRGFKGQHKIKAKDGDYYWQIHSKNSGLATGLYRDKKNISLTVYNNSNINEVTIHVPGKYYIILNEDGSIKRYTNYKKGDIQ